MTHATALAKEIRGYCIQHENRALADRDSRYFKEGYDSWGLMDGKHPMWNEKQKEWLEKYSSLGPAGFLELGELLFLSGKYEEGALAIRFLKTFRDVLDERSLPGLARWFECGIANWAHTDVLCGEVLAPLLEQGRIPLAALAGWRESKWKYQRRAVPVAMLGLLKNLADAAPFLDFLRPMMMDEERVVHQGLGWFLRETWKKKPDAVEAFLMEWKDRAARLIFQYATEKMTAAGKARFRRSKVGARGGAGLKSRAG